MKLFTRNIACPDAAPGRRQLFGNWTEYIFATIAALGLACVTMTATATVIAYNPTSLGGTQWRYDYAVTSDPGGPAIYEFTIFFDPARYSNLAVLAAPAGWDALAIEPDPGIPADGFFDALAFGAGIDPGNSLAGFSVSFDFLAGGSPGSQRFDIVDPDTFASIDTGVTVPIDAPAQVPAPGGLALVGLGFAVLAAVRRRA